MDDEEITGAAERADDLDTPPSAEQQAADGGIDEASEPTLEQDDHSAVPVNASASGPPADWYDRVSKHAPWLLTPGPSMVARRPRSEALDSTVSDTLAATAAGSELDAAANDPTPVAHDLAAAPALPVPPGGAPIQPSFDEVPTTASRASPAISTASRDADLPPANVPPSHDSAQPRVPSSADNASPAVELSPIAQPDMPLLFDADRVGARDDTGVVSGTVAIEREADQPLRAAERQVVSPAETLRTAPDQPRGHDSRLRRPSEPSVLGSGPEPTAPVVTLERLSGHRTSAAWVGLELDEPAQPSVRDVGIVWPPPRKALEAPLPGDRPAPTAPQIWHQDDEFVASGWESPWPSLPDEESVADNDEAIESVLSSRARWQRLIAEQESA